MFHVEPLKVMAIYRNTVMRCIGTKIILLLLLPTLLLGCKTALREPELIDPIYNDLLRLSAEKDREATMLREQFKQTLQDWNNAPLQTALPKFHREKYFRQKSELDRLLQMKQFYMLKAESRRIEARQSYLTAFRAGQAWPDPAEFKRYEANKRLQAVSRNWNQRVPKLIDRYDSSRVPAEAKTAAPAEH